MQHLTSELLALDELIDRAPSKFCAYIALPPSGPATQVETRSEMTVAFYTHIDGADRRFDGQRAWMHLTHNLGMHLVQAADVPDLMNHFERWLEKHQTAVSVHPAGPQFLLPPPWFR